MSQTTPASSQGTVIASGAAIVALVAGVWLIVAPWLLQWPFTRYSSVAHGVSIVYGALAIVFAFARLRRPQSTRIAAVLLVVVGAVALATPFFGGYDFGGSIAKVAWNFVVSGGVILICALVGLLGVFGGRQAT